MKLNWIFKNFRKSFLGIIYISLYSLIFSILGIALTMISKDIIEFALNGDYNKLTLYIILFIGISLINMVSMPLNNFIITIVKTKITNNIQFKLYKKIIHDKNFQNNTYSNLDIINRLNIDVNLITSFICEFIPNLIGLITTFILSFILLFKIEPIFAIVVIILTPITSILSKSLMNKQKEVYYQIQQNDVDNKTHMDESIKNLEILKIFQLERKNLDCIKLNQDNKLKLNKLSSKVSGAISLLFNFGSTISYLLVFSLGAYNLAQKKISISEFTVLIQLYRQVQSSMAAIQSYIPSLTNTSAAMDRILDIDNLTTEDLEINEEPITFENKIEFKDINFEYNNNLKVLKNVSITINKGDIVGIIGDSGIGKSTLLKILISSLKPTSGDISVDNKKLNVNHRKLMSYVPQDDMLFSMSIKENLLYSFNNLNNSDIEEALEFTKSKDFINKLPDGLNTNINLLSKGQRQRISLTRAILKKSPILLLDEATSALDNKTEKHIIDSIKNLPHKPTCIIVTHRDSILNICNKIYKIDNTYINQLLTT